VANTIKAIKGMHDVLPKDSAKWQNLENNLSNILNTFGYSQVRMPIVEKTEVFCRAIGEITDIVEKEMYSFVDKGKDSLSLRPEGTASCVRMMIEHNLPRENEQRIWYLGPMFRRERPQKGRYRQFHQLGVEVYGCQGAKIEAELIQITTQFWQSLGLKNLTLEINSLGSKEIRERYKSKLINYFNTQKDSLDTDSLKRLSTNPLRILDSKNPTMQSLINNAPKLIDELDGQSKANFEQLQTILKTINIPFVINPTLVRGLDYYNDIVFEWTTQELGSQGTVCAGGRYDSLMDKMGGNSTPAIGFAIGLERLLLLLESQNINIIKQKTKIYCVNIGEKAEIKSLEICQTLRQKIPNIIIFNHNNPDNLKKQFKKADKSQADFVIIIADDELKSNKITLKPLRTQQEQQTFTLDELIIFLQGLK